MNRGEQMDILVKDSDVVENLLALIRQIPDHSVIQHREEQIVRLTVKKLHR